MRDKTPLLLVPGLACNKSMWAGQIALLSDIADCWVAPLPAYDELRPIAEDILRDAPPRFALAGSSMGGYLCFEILRLAPERVLKLALIGTTADPEQPDVSERRWHMIRKSEQRGFLTMWREFIPRFLHPDLVDDQPLVETLVKQAYEIGYFTFRQHQIAMMKRKGYLDLLERISCPTTIVVGEEDILTPVETHRAMADAIPNATLLVLQRAGHLLSMERPKETADVFRSWLTGQPLLWAA